MIYVVKNIRIFMAVVICFNFAITQTGERKSFPVPKSRVHKDSTATLILFSPLMVMGSLQGMINNIRFPHLICNMDFSYVTKIAQENKVMLSVAASAILCALCIKQLQQSETCGAWCSEKYEKVSTSVDNYTDACIKEYPLPVQAVVAPIKLMMQFLCSVMKKYISMNRTTIMYATTSPVLGRALDCGGVLCPLPFLNWAAIGGGVSAYVCVKGYFDQSFEEMRTDLKNFEKKFDDADAKNMLQHNTTQEKVGALSNTVESSIQWVKRNITKVNNKIENIAKRIGQLGTSVTQKLTDVSQEMAGLKRNIDLLHRKIDQQNEKSTAQYDDLKGELEKLQQSYNTVFLLLEKKAESDEQLRQELNNFSAIYQKDHELLRKDLGITATQLSHQIDDVKKEVKNGFASQNRSTLSFPQKPLSESDLSEQRLLLALNNS
jgi:hypothetical protein